MLYDLDGTVTSTSGVTVVKDDDFIKTAKCVSRSNWNMAPCNEYIGQVGIEFMLYNVAHRRSWTSKIVIVVLVRSLKMPISNGLTKTTIKTDNSYWSTSDCVIAQCMLVR